MSLRTMKSPLTMTFLYHANKGRLKKSKHRRLNIVPYSLEDKCQLINTRAFARKLKFLFSRILTTMSLERRQGD